MFSEYIYFMQTKLLLDRSLCHCWKQKISFKSK